ncbi:hypothetical protein VNO77_15690 [Canavalia gladiata]|uniref:E3 ubiquitin-protein ligase RMA n=1 Tax=Canavalia gladiata TaxID=3824 RepID=A0AAN9LZ81_CANGL
MKRLNEENRFLVTFFQRHQGIAALELRSQTQGIDIGCLAKQSKVFDTLDIEVVMEEETSEAMNLDLNLGPSPEPLAGAIASEGINFDDWIEEPFNRLSEAMRRRARHRWRWRRRHHHDLHHHFPAEEWWHHFRGGENVAAVELDRFLVHSRNGNVVQDGEGSVAAEEREREVPKADEINNGSVSLDETIEKKENVEEGGSSDKGFFDCNICLDLAKDPVVTCCGHLFCWPCLYKWLHLHSDAKECPVCKGEVTVKSITPIYGRGNIVRVAEEDSTLKIPMRPNARRVAGESTVRQTIHRNVGRDVEGMIRQVESRFELAEDEHGNAQSTSSLLRRLATRGMRREHNPAVAPQDDVAQNTVGSSASLARDNHRLQALLLRRTQAQRGTTTTTTTSAFNSAERLIEAFIRSNPLGRNQEQQDPPIEDRDSFSSIGAVINSESQVDSAVEIDSLVSLSTSSSGRRNDASRVSDMDSGDSRAPRRRRLN